MSNEHIRSHDSLNDLVRTVESQGLECGITMWIAGMELDGILTPWYKYAAWLRDAADDVVPEALLKAAGEGWDRRTATGFPAAAVSNDVPSRFHQFALRDVEVRRAGATQSRRFPFLVCHVAAVVAYVPGAIPVT